MSTTTGSTNIITASSIENALFLADSQRRRMIARVNAYTEYNNQDRILNCFYRYFQVDKPSTGPLSLGISSAANWLYEKQTNFFSQHLWSTAALMGVGTAINANGFSAAPESLAFAEAWVGLSRQIVNTSLECMIEVANRYRYSERLNDVDGHVSVSIPASLKWFDTVAPRRLSAALTAEMTAAEWKTWRAKVGAGIGSIGFTLNAAAAVGMNAAMLNDAIKKGDPIKIAACALQLISSVLSVATNAAKATAGYGPVLKAVVGALTPATGTKAGIAGSAIGLAQALVSAGAIAPYLADPSLSDAQKGAIGAEIGMQILGGAAQIGANAYLVNHLVIDIMGSQDANGNNPTNKVTIQNHYAGTQYQVERIVSSDGKVLAAANADSVVQVLKNMYEPYLCTTINTGSTLGQSTWNAMSSAWSTTDATVSNLIAAMAQMAPPAAGTTLAPSDYQNRVTAIYAANVMN